MLLWGQQRVTGSLCDNCDNNNTLKSTQVSTIKCPYKYQKWKYLFCRNMWLMHDSDIIRRLILVCEQHFPVAQDGAGFNFYIYSTQHIQRKYMNKTNLTQTNVAQLWICWWEERLILCVNSHDTGVITTQDFFKTWLKHVGESVLLLCLCGAFRSGVSIEQKKRAT